MKGTSGSSWFKGTIVTYTKFYVKIPQKSGLPHLRQQGNEGPSLLQAHGPITISRRYAAAI